MRRLGIVGAGKMGTTIARAALAAGYDVAIAGSGAPEAIALTVEVLAPGARAAARDDVIRHADLVVLAIPTHRFRELGPDALDGKVVVDAMNYWQPVDGDDVELSTAPHGTSVVVQSHFASARVVKALNQLGYHELDEFRRPGGAADRVAMGVAGDDPSAVRAVMELVEDLGFDPVDAGSLANGALLEPDGSPFAVTYTAAQFADRVGAGRQLQRAEVAESVGLGSGPWSPKSQNSITIQGSGSGSRATRIMRRAQNG